jgi:F420-non-reducing hydrogenase small subunit
VEGVEDSGAKFISAMASILDAESDEEVATVVNQFVDPAGYLYRFSAPASTLQKKRTNKKTSE